MHWYVIFCVFTYFHCCFSVIWLISPLDGKSPVAVVPPGMVPKATVVGHLFRHSCPWQHGVTWILQPHPFHRSAPRCYEWQSTDTEEVSCTHRYTTSSQRYCTTVFLFFLWLKKLMLENPPMWLNCNNCAKMSGSKFPDSAVKDSLQVMANT